MNTKEIRAQLDATRNSDRKPLDHYPTPPVLAGEMVFFVKSCLRRDVRILEPSAGDGAILSALETELQKTNEALTSWEIAPTVWNVTAVELDPLNVNILREKAKKSPLAMTLYEQDFLTFKDEPFDIILMNPPFRRTLWKKHLKHALSLLKPDGMLASVVPLTLMQDKALLRTLGLDECCLYEVSDSFINTKVSVCLIVLTKNGKSQKPYDGVETRAEWAFPLYLSSAQYKLIQSVIKDGEEKAVQTILCIAEEILLQRPELITLSECGAKRLYQSYLEEMVE